MRSAHSEAPYLSKNGYNYNNPLRFIILTLSSHCMTFPNFFLKQDRTIVWQLNYKGMIAHGLPHGLISFYQRKRKLS